MSMTNIRRVIHAALFTPTRSGWGLPILFWGKPGIGKSDIIEGVSTSIGWGSPNDDDPEHSHCEVLSPGERGEGGYGCTPMPDAEGFISYPPPRWTAKFGPAGGLLFHDEINTAPPAIQAPLLGLLLKRRIGGAQLHSSTRQMAAANDVADAAGGWDLAPPMANRLGHLPWEAPSENEWTDWLMSGSDEPAAHGDSAAKVEAAVMAKWPEEWARVRGLVAGFIRAKPANLHAQPASGSPESSKAWPSHRSWESATRALASARCHGMSEADGDMFAAAFVGSGALGELITYRKDADLPDPRALLDGKITWKPDMKRLDRTYAVLGSTTSLMMSDINEAGGDAKARKDARVMKRFDVFIKLLSATADGAVDLCWGPAKALAKSGIHASTEESKAVMRKLLPMINAMDGR